MAESFELQATERTTVGKANQHMRNTGRMPAVVYGAAIESKAIELDRHRVERLLSQEGLATSLIKLAIGDEKPVNVIVKEIKRDPVRGTIDHIDFWAIKMTQQIQTTVPLHFIGDAPGVKAGGVMTHNLRELSIEALPTHLPDFVDADVSALEIGDSLHVSALPVPEGVTLLTPADEIVVSVLAPKIEEVEEVEELEEGAEAEPELIGETAEEGSEE